MIVYQNTEKRKFDKEVNLKSLDALGKRMIYCKNALKDLQEKKEIEKIKSDPTHISIRIPKESAHNIINKKIEKHCSIEPKNYQSFKQIIDTIMKFIPSDTQTIFIKDVKKNHAGASYEYKQTGC